MGRGMGEGKMGEEGERPSCEGREVKAWKLKS